MQCASNARRDRPQEWTHYVSAAAAITAAAGAGTTSAATVVILKRGGWNNHSRTAAITEAAGAVLTAVTGVINNSSQQLKNFSICGSATIIYTPTSIVCARNSNATNAINYLKKKYI